MNGHKLFYIFACPLGANDSKIGITGHPEVRLGSYQNSYSRRSHQACFNLAYWGPARAIEQLERVIKQRYNWHIERDGRGASEWIYDMDPNAIAQIVDELIDGFRFKIQKIPKSHLPITVDNLTTLYQKYPELVEPKHIDAGTV